MISQFSILKTFPVNSAFTDKILGNIDFRFGEEKLVLQNRQKIAQAFGLQATDLFEMDQVHGCRTRVIGKNSSNIQLATDSLITKRKNILLLVKTADCFPIFFYDPENEIVAIIHAGWRGAIQKIFLETLFLLEKDYKSRPDKIIAGIGPGIRSCCLLEQKFIQEKLPEWQKFIKSNKNNSKSIDIPGFCKKKLVDCGLKPSNIQDVGICTNCHANYFSHRKSREFHEKQGRMATVIGLKK